MMSESSKRHSKFLSLIFILKCLSKASVIKRKDNHANAIAKKKKLYINRVCKNLLQTKHKVCKAVFS